MEEISKGNFLYVMQGKWLGRITQEDFQETETMKNLAQR